MKANIILVAVLVIAFVFAMVCTVQAYSYYDDYNYYEDNERGEEHEYESEWDQRPTDEDEEGLEYYDYQTGQWRTIPEPDPWIGGPGVGCGCPFMGGMSIIVFGVMFFFFFIIMSWILEIIYYEKK
jgi:uncharacterized membrane protein (DUF485 family)